MNVCFTILSSKEWKLMIARTPPFAKQGTAYKDMSALDQAMPSPLPFGPLPAPVQNFTSYAATTHTAAPNARGAAEFLAFLAKPDTRKIFAEKGVE